MSLHEQCNTLHQRLIKKINSWPPDTVSASNTLMSNLSNNFSYISNNFTYNFNNLSANFSGNFSGSSIKSNSTLNSDPPAKANGNANGKLPSPSALPPIATNGKLSNSSPNSACTSNGRPSLTSNELKPSAPETDGNLSNNKSPKSNTPISSPTHSQASSLSSNSIVQVNNTKLDEDLIDVICKLNQKCEFLNRYGQRHDYTGKQVNGYFSMLRIIYSFFEYVFNQKKRKMFPEIIEVGKLLLHVLNAMEEYTKKYAELRLRYDNGDYNFDLLTDYEDDEEIGKKKGDSSGKSGNSDGSSSEDELDEINNFDNISSNLVKMSSNLALSLESMKSSIFDDLANNNETYDAIEEEEDDEEKEKIEDYYRNNELKDNEDDKEYGKEIKAEEYESTLQKYYKRFNFNFKLSKSKSCTSPVNEGGSPKKSISASSTNSGGSAGNQRPDSPSKKPVRAEPKKYYKYFSNLRNNFEENFNKQVNKLTNNSNSEASFFKSISDDTTTSNSPKNGKLPNSASSNALKRDAGAHQDGIFLEDSLDQEESIPETEEERQLRNAKLDEYILSKFPITNDDLHLVTPPLLYFYEGFTLTLNRERELSLIYGRVGPFWYHKSAANIVSLVRNLVVILTSKPSKSITSLYNTDTCARIFAHRQVNATLDSLLQGLATLEIKAYNRRYFKYLYREHVIYGKTLRMPVHSEFEIPVEGNELIRHKDGETANGESKSKVNGSTVPEESKDEKVIVENVGFNSRSVRCRLINYVRNENETEICENSHKCLLVHHHGGGFVLSSPDSHELYLRDWAIKLRGIPILSVDYTLRQPFPRAPQDVLDVYMFLVDPKNKLAVSEMIGFQPEKIIIAGDSAGANLAFSLICCLNEIKRNYPEYANLKMPSSIVCVYGAFDIRGVMSPSKFISAFDPILHHGNIMAMIGTYAGITQKIRPTLWSRIKYRRSIAWYRVSERELKARFKALSKAMDSFFASPLTYPRLEDLKEISLHLISTHYCPLIDDSVVLYKAWQGPSTFDIFDGLPHAFLNFSDRSEEAKIATNKVAERIVQAFRRTPTTNDQKTKPN